MFSNKQLKIIGVEISRPESVTDSGALPSTQERLNLAIEVENLGDEPLFLWAGLRSYDYDANSHLLTLYLTEHIPALPPGIVRLSDHFRTPAQAEVGLKSRATVSVSIPKIMRRRIPSKGLGLKLVEEQIEQIGEVALHIQFADKPMEALEGEIPADYRKRLSTHGIILLSTIISTESKDNN